MKKILVVLNTVLVASAAFVIGFEFNDYLYNNESLYEANRYKAELIDAQIEALGKAESLIDKHNLWDVDGSDLMVGFISAANKADSIYSVGQ